MSNINLLPAEFKTEINQARANGKLFSLILRSSVFVFLVLAVYVGMLIYLSAQAASSQKELAEKEKQVDKYGTLEEDSKKIAGRLNTISTIDKVTPRWSGVIEEIQKIMPSGVYLNSIKIDSNLKTRNQLQGYALSKKEVAALRDLMEKSEKFQYVDIESSSTVIDPASKKEKESFTLSFSLEKGALK